MMPAIDPLQHTRILDLSHWNVLEDAQKVVESGIRACYLKVCEWLYWRSASFGGPYYKDDTFDSKHEALSDAGMPLGAYEFYRGNDRKPIPQAAWFRQSVGEAEIQFEIVDVETKPSSVTVAQFTHDLWIHVQEVEQQFGRTPWIYTRKSFWDPNVLNRDLHGNVIDWSRFPLISAHYNLWITQPWIPAAWENRGKREVLWQISDKWINPGLPRAVDLNLALDPDRFFSLLGAEIPMTLEERVADLERRVAILEG